MADITKISKLKIGTKSYDVVDAEAARKTTTVQGKALSSDVVIYGSEIDADSGTAVKLIGSDHKIPLSLIPDAILGQLTFGGSFDGNGIATISDSLKAKLGISDSTIQLINSATDDKTQTPKEYGYKTLEGVYFLADATFEIAGIKFEVGDWLVSIGNAWKKIDNTDAVTGVKGDKESTYRIGNVNLTCDNIGAEPKFTDGFATIAVVNDANDSIQFKGVSQTNGAISAGSDIVNAVAYTKGKVDDLLSSKVSGPAESITNRVAIFDGTTGGVLQQSGFYAYDTGSGGSLKTTVGASNLTIASYAGINFNAADGYFLFEEDVALKSQNSAYEAALHCTNLSANRRLDIPNKNGTLALLSDIEDAGFLTAADIANGFTLNDQKGITFTEKGGVLYGDNDDEHLYYKAYGNEDVLQFPVNYEGGDTIATQFWVANAVSVNNAATRPEENAVVNDAKVNAISGSTYGELEFTFGEVEVNM